MALKRLRWALDAELHTPQDISPADAENFLIDLAAVFLSNSAQPFTQLAIRSTTSSLPNTNEIYRALVEQIPAVIFMAHLDRGIGEAYVSPQIEATLGFSQEEWLEDPIRWYQQIHPDDKERWSVEAAQMFLSGTAASVGVPGYCTGWQGRLVSLRSKDDPPQGWASVVHPRRRLRHH